MTKQECAIVTAYTEISMLRGDDLKYLYRYLSEIIGRPVFSHEILDVCELFRDRIKADFIALCRNASDDTARDDEPTKAPTVKPEVRRGQWVYDETIGGMKHYCCTSCKECNPGSECFADENQILWFAFCPKCGARMEGGTDDAGHCGAMMDGGTISRERFAEIMGEDEQS